MRGKSAATAKKLPRSGDTESRKVRVTEEHRREAAKLKTLFEAYKVSQAAKGVKITQAGFGAEHGIGVQGMVWQYLNGATPLNLPAAVAFASALGCQIADFSKRLAAEQIALGPPGAAPGPKTALQSVLELNPIEQQLLGLYRELKPEQQTELVLLANNLHAATHPHASPANPFGGRKRRVTEKED
jgi:hypothetical protein